MTNRVPRLGDDTIDQTVKRLKYDVLSQCRMVKWKLTDTDLVPRESDRIVDDLRKLVTDIHQKNGQLDSIRVTVTLSPDGQYHMRASSFERAT